MRTKRNLLTLPTLVCLVALTATAQAHPGRTDKYGCHTDSKTGSYHCHGGGSSSPSSSYTPSSPTATPPPPTVPPAPTQPAITVESLIAQIGASYEAGNIDQALVLCGQLKIALEKDRATLAVALTAEPSVTRPTSPLAFETSDGIKGTIAFPGPRAYVFKPFSAAREGDTRGSISVSIPGSLAIEGKLFRVGSTVLAASFVSSAPDVIQVSDRGTLSVKGPGQAAVSTTIGDFRVVLQFEVVQLPFHELATQSAVVEAMGFPDDTNGNLWHWKAYPDMCLDVRSLLGVYSSWDGAFVRHWK